VKRVKRMNARWTDRNIVPNGVVYSALEYIIEIRTQISGTVEAKKLNGAERGN
jgi:hypothetical protein